MGNRKTKVTFEVSAYTIYSENVYIVGSVPELGEWNPKRAIKMRTDEKMYPLWISDGILLDISKSNIQYKYLKILNGNVLWEHGHDRYITNDPNNILESLKKCDDKFCHRSIIYYRKHGMVYEEEEGKAYRAKYGYNFSKEHKLLCPFHNLNDKQFLVSDDKIISYDCIKHEVDCYNMHKCPIIIENNIMYTVSSIGICKYDMNTGIGSLILCEKLISPIKMIIVNFQYLYAICENYTHKINLFENTDRIINIRKNTLKYDESLAVKCIGNRYIYHITKLFIEKFDILDEDAGWEEIYKFNENFSKIPFIFTGFMSECEILFYNSESKLFIVNLEAKTLSYYKDFSTNFVYDYGYADNPFNKIYKCNEHDCFFVKNSCEFLAFKINGYNFKKLKKIEDTFIQEYNKINDFLSLVNANLK